MRITGCSCGIHKSGGTDPIAAATTSDGQPGWMRDIDSAATATGRGIGGRGSLVGKKGVKRCMKRGVGNGAEKYVKAEDRDADKNIEEIGGKQGEESDNCGGQKPEHLGRRRIAMMTESVVVEGRKQRSRQRSVRMNTDAEEPEDVAEEGGDLKRVKFER